MKKRQWMVMIAAVVVSALPLLSIDINDTKLLTQPAIGKTHIAFVYANDLWVAGLDGKNVRRLTTRPGHRGISGVFARRQADRLQRPV